MKINLGGAVTLLMGIGLDRLARKFFETTPDISSWSGGQWAVMGMTMIGALVLVGLALTPPDYNKLQELVKDCKSKGSEK